MSLRTLVAATPVLAATLLLHAAPNEVRDETPWSAQGPGSTVPQPPFLQLSADSLAWGGVSARQPAGRPNNTPPVWTPLLPEVLPADVRAWGGVAAQAPEGVPPLPPGVTWAAAGPAGEPAADASGVSPPPGWIEPEPDIFTTRICTDCYAGDLRENEPDCAADYADAFNGGCNSFPNVFSPIDCGQSVCGRYGTFLNGASSFRDTDWYTFTLSQTADVTWSVVGGARTRLFIMQGSCPAVSLGTAVGDACATVSVSLTSLPAGTYYAFVGTDVFSGVPCGTPYRATLNVTPCCVGPAQSGDLTEGEPLCADASTDAFNGGCNSAPNVFSAIDCGQTVRGTYGTFLSPTGANFRDTDWYRFTLYEPATVTWSAVGQARTRLFILQGPSCPAGSLAGAVGDACTTVQASVTLPAGTYFAFIATDVFTGVPCGSRYSATLTATPCCVGPSQPTDQIEGEPLCADAYVDAFNGGCNSTPAVYSSVECGRPVSGTYGTFLSAGGAAFRDTDWYTFTLTQTSNVTWTAIGEAATRVFILAETCPPSALGTATAPACSNATLNLASLPAGTYRAFVGTDVFTGVPCGARYRARLDTAACCPVSPQSGDRIEGEQLCTNAYNDPFNGGCNSTPNVFSPIDCNQTVAGTYGTFLSAGGGAVRDTDWYRFTIATPQTVTWAAQGDGPTRVFVMQEVCPAVLISTAGAPACGTASITLSLAAGSYYGFVGTDVFSGVPCGARYRATLTTSGCPLVCDSIDFNGDTIYPDVQDITDFITVFSGGACPSGACGDIDFNNDSLFPDTADIQALISVFAGGPCI